MSALRYSLLLSFAINHAAAQVSAVASSGLPDADTIRIGRTIPDNVALAPLIYLASDKFKGRDIALPQLDSAAAYIAWKFKRAGARRRDRDPE